MKFGRFEISLFNFGFFRLDGGAMFGAVPKNLWAKRIAADEENGIRLATRSLVIRDGDTIFLVDVGLGEKWDDKSKKIFAIENSPLTSRFVRECGVTDIILTHLHFDHAGGISYMKNGALSLTYPDATVHLQDDNYKNASSPNVRERASYIKENVEVLSQGKLRLLRGSQEIYPDIWVHQVHGHTRGQQWVEVKGPDRSVVFPTDMMPTSHHIPLPFHMGYDMCTETLLKDKETFLKNCVERQHIVVFQHDPHVAAGTITKDARGHFTLSETLPIEAFDGSLL